MARVPNLFIVGAAKCGTTALHEFLQQHPEIFLTEPKELNYFCSDFTQRFGGERRTPDDYMGYYAKWANQAYAGESSVLYLLSETGARDLLQFSPQARIVIMLRNPIDLVHSLFYQLRKTGEEDQSTFEAALALEEPRRQGSIAVPKPTSPWSALLSYRQAGLLSPQVARYLKAFSRDRIHFVLYDDFSVDAAAATRRVLEFLGLETRITLNTRVVNASTSVRSEWLWRLKNHPPAWMRAAWKRFMPEGPRAAAMRRINHLNTKVQPRPQMDPATYEHLRQAFADDIARLGTLIGRDLNHWLTQPSGDR